MIGGNMLKLCLIMIKYSCVRGKLMCNQAVRAAPLFFLHFTLTISMIFVAIPIMINVQKL